MKKIVLGVSASISVYKAVEIVRLLKKRGFWVKVLMTKDATKFISPLTFEVVSEEKVIVDQFEDANNREVEHIRLAREADLFLIAPASLDLIGKLSSGLADSFLSLFFFAFEKKVLIAPAMNSSMFKHPVNQKNIGYLKGVGVEFLEPDSGSLACGEEGIGRLPEPEDIVERVVFETEEKIFLGKKIIITGGPTREKLDVFRFVSNPSSGKTGYYLAKKARDFGADVLFISGKTCFDGLWGVDYVEVEAAEDMKREVEKGISSADILIMSAAVADFKPSKYSRGKIKKEKISSLMGVEFERTPDILKELSKDKKKGQIFVGFSAQDNEETEEAERKLREKRLDLIVLNNIMEERGGFDSEENRVILIFNDGEMRKTDFILKEELAEVILRAIYEKWIKRIE